MSNFLLFSSSINPLLHSLSVSITRIEFLAFDTSHLLEPLLRNLGGRVLTCYKDAKEHQMEDWFWQIQFKKSFIISKEYQCSDMLFRLDCTYIF
jgi:hypothetical protein